VRIDEEKWVGRKWGNRKRGGYAGGREGGSYKGERGRGSDRNGRCAGFIHVEGAFLSRDSF
jgi:hypothetical protein